MFFFQGSRNASPNDRGNTSDTGVPSPHDRQRTNSRGAIVPPPVPYSNGNANGGVTMNLDVPQNGNGNGVFRQRSKSKELPVDQNGVVVRPQNNNSNGNGQYQFAAKDYQSAGMTPMGYTAAGNGLSGSYGNGNGAANGANGNGANGNLANGGNGYPNGNGNGKATENYGSAYLPAAYGNGAVDSTVRSNDFMERDATLLHKDKLNMLDAETRDVFAPTHKSIELKQKHQQTEAHINIFRQYIGDLLQEADSYQEQCERMALLMKQYKLEIIHHKKEKLFQYFDASSQSLAAHAFMAWKCYLKDQILSFRERRSEELRLMMERDFNKKMVS